ncbi:hypothetical protein B9479_002615 [Cryptococcus floricola]|uniref:HAT C-terminal dimerisation domain-containing protein n=1 Tax=Cryptococcus floricola TaxID=2591691 RepID=A0A5D3AZA5_9TREE|nr:hypothetical protein B9479_002615 [Cryptococcus floricola]
MPTADSLHQVAPLTRTASRAPRNGWVVSTVSGVSLTNLEDEHPVISTILGQGDGSRYRRRPWPKAFVRTPSGVTMRDLYNLEVERVGEDVLLARLKAAMADAEIKRATGLTQDGRYAYVEEQVSDIEACMARMAQYAQVGSFLVFASAHPYGHTLQNIKVSHNAVQFVSRQRIINPHELMVKMGNYLKGGVEALQPGIPETPASAQEGQVRDHMSDNLQSESISVMDANRNDWLKSLKDTDYVWASEESLTKYSKKISLGIQPLDHCAPHLFPNRASTWGLTTLTKRSTATMPGSISEFRGRVSSRRAYASFGTQLDDDKWEALIENWETDMGTDGRSAVAHLLDWIKLVGENRTVCNYQAYRGDAGVLQSKEMITSEALAYIHAKGCDPKRTVGSVSSKLDDFKKKYTLANDKVLKPTGQGNELPGETLKIKLEEICPYFYDLHPILKDTASVVNQESATSRAIKGRTTIDLDLVNHDAQTSEVVQIMKVFKSGTLLFSQSDTPLLAGVVTWMENLMKYLDQKIINATEEQASNDADEEFPMEGSFPATMRRHVYSDNIRLAACLTQVLMEKYYNKTQESDLYRCAFFLDPSYRNRLRQIIRDRHHPAMVTLRERFSMYEAPAAPAPRQAAKKTSIFGIPGFDESDEEDDMEGCSDLDRWLNHGASASRDTNPLIYWEARRHEYPTLSQMALDLFSIPATSVDVERSFSHGRLTKTYLRARLSETSFRNTETLGSWLKMEDILSFEWLEPQDFEPDFESI